MSAQSMGSGLAVNLDPKASAWRADYERTATAGGPRLRAVVTRCDEGGFIRYLHQGTELHSSRAAALAEARAALALTTGAPK